MAEIWLTTKDLRMMIVPSLIGALNHPRWLFGILSINSSNLVIFDLSSLD